MAFGLPGINEYVKKRAGQKRGADPLRMTQMRRGEEKTIALSLYYRHALSRVIAQPPGAQ